VCEQQWFAIENENIWASFRRLWPLLEDIISTEKLIDCNRTKYTGLL
jgi:hypothetical protein